MEISPRFWRTALLLGSSAALFLFCLCIGQLAFVELPMLLVGGWIPFLARVWPQITIDVGGVATGIVCLMVLTVGLHEFMDWLCRETQQPVEGSDAPVATWHWRWSLSIVGVIVLMFVAGISAVGVTHQTYWLASSPEPWASSTQFAWYQSRLANDVKQFMLAVHNYASNHQDRLPPVRIEDAQGRPLLSWRVLILPYLEKESLYKQFKLDESWDSPHNLALLPKMPMFYMVPAETRFSLSEKERCFTAYRIFVGPKTLYPSDGAQSPYTINTVPDGASETILIVEAETAVPWTKPDELTYAPERPLPKLGGAIRGKFLVGMLDGTVRVVNMTVSEDTLRRAIEADDGQRLGDDWK